MQMCISNLLNSVIRTGQEHNKSNHFNILYMKKGMSKKMAPKMQMGGKVQKPAPITTAGGTNLNGMSKPNKMS